MAIQAQNINFGSSGLAGEVSNNPTSLQFGPDGRLYVSQQNGTIYAYSIVRNAVNDYAVTNTEVINLVKAIPNHNDDGTPSGESNRQVTGIYVTGTPANPILYVSSSDPRIGAGGGGADIGLDTNSGVVSKLTCSGGIDGNGECTGWTKVDLVRGFPRSEENHAVNGMQLDETTNTMYLAIGGHTNAGAPSNNFAFTTEYALSAAIVKIDLNTVEALPTQTDPEGTAYKYNLPTLQNVSKTELLANDNDHPAPWGGDDGLNQAMLDPNGPVQIYATGFRNLYDIVLTESGRMYGVDNGANGGWGGFPEYEESYDVTNNFVPGEPGSTGSGVDPSTYPAGVTLHDGLNGTVLSDGLADSQVNNKNGLHLIPEGYYGGHPAPIRANPDGAGLYYNGTFYAPGDPNLPASWPPVPSELANPVEGDFQNSGIDDGALANYGPSTNGIAEYTASNFGGALQGDLLAAGFSGSGPIYHIILDGTGTDVTNCPDPQNNCNETLFSGFGSQPLDVIAQGDDDPFGGTVWAVAYGDDNIVVFEPADYNGNDPGTCDGLDDDTIDEDGDGFTNADEIANGTNPCSGASQPNDFDGVVEFNGFKRSDLLDTDDDNDGIPDVDDAFCFDPDNGAGGIGDIPFRLELFNATGYGFGNIGFTGIMTNGTDDYFTLLDDSGDELVYGGTAGIYTDPTVSEGDAFQTNNTQKNGFQFPINVNAASAPFSITGQINGPFFNNQTPQNFASHGIFMGTGDQDNYIKLVLNSGGLQKLVENAGTTTQENFSVQGILDATAIRLFFSVDPGAGTVQPSYSIDGGPRTNVGSPITLSGDLLSVVQGTYTINGIPSVLAAGTMATSFGTAPEFAASWDYFDVAENPSDVTAKVEVNTSGINGSTFGNSSFVIQNTSSGPQITNVTFDLSSAIIQEVVFDPNGTAGDATAKDLTLNNGTDGGTGFISHGFSNPYEGGFYGLSLDFNDFGPNESIVFGLDIDPISIKDGSAPGPNEAGSVSGLELAGSVVTVTFDNGDTWTVELYRTQPDNNGSSENIVRNALPVAPILAMDGLPTQSVTPIANQTVTVSAPVGSQVSLLQLEAGLFVSQLDGTYAGTGYSIDPWEVNSVIGVQEFDQIVDNSGTAVFDVTLTDSDPEAGYNLFAAVIVDPDGATSPLSNVVIVDYDVDAVPADEIYINAGGQQFTDSNGIAWEADQFFSNGQAFSNTSVDIANTTDDILYQTERYDAALVYQIPVSTTGPYTVNLHFAEIFFGVGANAGGPGSRVFDVLIEGNSVLPAYDIAADVGSAAAVVKSFQNITVNDGLLTIAFNASVNNGKIAAIEVVGGSGDPGPVAINVSPISDQVITEGSSPILAVSATGGDGNLSYVATGLPPGLSLEPTNGQFFGTVSEGVATGGPNSDGTYPVTVTIDDSDGQTTDAVQISFAWTVSGPPVAGDILFRVNAGGPEIPAADGSSPVWGADTGLFGDAGNSPYLAAGTNTDGIYDGDATNAHPGDIIMTDPSLAGIPGAPSSIFNTERWDPPALPEMLWQFPVAEGTQVQVTLLFAELFSNIAAAGQRVFDVSVDGSVPAVFNDIDPFAVAGAKGAFVLSHTLVSDGVIDLEFIHGVENPALKGIQITAVDGTGNLAPVVSNPGPQSGVEGDNVSLQITATDTDDCGDLTYSAQNLPPNLSIDPATGLITGTLLEGTGTGTPGAFIEENGIVVIEMENNPDIGGNWKTSANTTTSTNISNPGAATGGDFIVWEAAQNLSTPGIGVLTYPVEITTPGVYRFQWRSQVGFGTSSTDHNDTWLKIEADSFYGEKSGGSIVCPKGLDPLQNNCTGDAPEGAGSGGWFKVYSSGSTNWTWSTLTSDNDGHQIYASFDAAGTYNISISARSSSHVIDRMVLTLDSQYSTSAGQDLNLPESTQNEGGTPGAAANSPYDVQVTVTDACEPGLSSQVNFTWNVSDTPPTGTASALFEITPGGGIGASTFGSNSLQLTNNSTGNLQITGISIDLSTGILPDNVFDPVGTGGDETASCFTPNSGATAVGLIAPANPCTDPFSQPRNGGFDVMSVNFADFDPGEQFFFTVDIDPNSIQGVPGAGGAGSVSGLELIGATITITFNDGSTIVTSLFEDGSLGGGQTAAATSVPSAPTISVVGIDGESACVESTSQTITVSGTPGSNVALLGLDTRLYIQSGEDPFNVSDPTFYANEAMGKALYTAVVGQDGTVDIPVTLLQTDPGDGTPTGGLNYFMAVQSDEPYGVDQPVSQTSNLVILNLDPACVGSTLTVNATLQTRTDHSGDYTVKLYQSGALVYDLIGTADAAGAMTLVGIVPGTYEVAVKFPNSLQAVETVIVETAGSIVNMGELPMGDANNDNLVTLADYSALIASFNTADGDTGFNASVDFNADGIVTLPDYSVLISNFNTAGEEPTP